MAYTPPLHFYVLPLRKEDWLLIHKALIEIDTDPSDPDFDRAVDILVGIDRMLEVQ
jgi:hypothetical protein